MPYELGQIRRQVKGALVLVDGYTQSTVEDNTQGLLPCDIPTSCQYDAKQDDPVNLVVLPAWRSDDLVTFACMTSWVVDTGFRKVLSRVLPETRKKIAWEQYFYSGGSLREFWKTREELRYRIALDCSKVSVNRAYALVYTYTGERSEDQSDRIRRHYVTDPANEAHYIDADHWKVVVDSGYTLKKLGQRVTMKDQLDVYKYAQAVGAGFWGIAFELLLHRAVREASPTRRPVVIQFSSGSHYDRLEIRVLHIECGGTTEEDCYTRLHNLGSDTYWHPDYPTFPVIDAVAPCDAYRPGQATPERVLAYIQVTISAQKTFKPASLAQLNTAVAQNPTLSAIATRLFVVVRPDVGAFELKDAPDTESIRVLVGCFDPDSVVAIEAPATAPMAMTAATMVAPAAATSVSVVNEQCSRRD